MAAKLHRFLKLNDRFDSQVFTFVLPAKLVTDDNPDAYTKDVVYGYHKWTVSITRTDAHLGCFLKLQTAGNGMKCQIDFSFTLLNREHFTRNETFIEKACIFTPESNQHGRKAFIALNDLLEREFAQVAGDYLIELEMRKINCIFECFIRLPKEQQHNRLQTYDTKLESSYFTYGLFDWSISLSQIESTMQQDETLTLQLHRHTSFDHVCNVRYYISIGESDGFQSEELDQLVDLTGNGDLYVVNGSLQQLAKGRSSLKVKVNMVSVVSISEVTLNVSTKGKTRAHLYDKDKQAWLMEADTSGKTLSFRLYYTDITHVPRKYSRYVCWNVLVLTRYIPDHKVKTNYGPFSRYYIQQDLDEGHLITTSIPVNELQDDRCLFTEPGDQGITVHVEWVDSHLLATPNYHAFDDVDKLQKQQMKREILALQSENLVLEKQLHSYQMSLAKSSDKDSGFSTGSIPEKTSTTSEQSPVSKERKSSGDRRNILNEKSTNPKKYDVPMPSDVISAKSTSFSDRVRSPAEKVPASKYSNLPEQYAYLKEKSNGKSALKNDKIQPSTNKPDSGSEKITQQAEKSSYKPPDKYSGMTASKNVMFEEKTGTNSDKYNTPSVRQVSDKQIPTSDKYATVVDKSQLSSTKYGAVVDKSTPYSDKYGDSFERYYDPYGDPADKFDRSRDKNYVGVDKYGSMGDKLYTSDLTADKAYTSDKYNAIGDEAYSSDKYSRSNDRPYNKAEKPYGTLDKYSSAVEQPNTSSEKYVQPPERSFQTYSEKNSVTRNERANSSSSDRSERYRTVDSTYSNADKYEYTQDRYKPHDSPRPSSYDERKGSRESIRREGRRSSRERGYEKESSKSEERMSYRYR
ncbi:hypothetical protein MAR_026687 [Mya arenaria]|uniref:MATH domain-containing protein n=1 Tax=Mya arenaria TaxID=6604 RepID=A0ABY7EU94_MYAAR|nr:uncharacterized protein LOC128244956 [Mya arenaria]WAR12507.1 hypothetical protein MAR_026687 [Mya arenaria]